MISIQQTALLVSVIVILLSIFVINLKQFVAQEHESDLDRRSFIWAKVSYQLVPAGFPHNSTNMLVLPRAFMHYASYVTSYLTTLREPDLLQIPHQDVDIAVPLSYSPSEEAKGKSSSIKIRLYNHKDGIKKPVMIWYHGGGWVLGDMVSDHSFCLRFAKELGFLVVNVDYRLAPEHVFPASIEDSYLAFRWVIKNINKYGGDPKRIVVGGESAGGNLAAAVTTKHLHEKNKRQIYPLTASPIMGLYLVYPVLAPFSNLSSPAVNRYAHTSGMLSLRTMENMRALYSGSRNGSVRYNDLYAPLLTPPHILQHYPPTLFILAKYDVLTEESEQFADKLRGHNIPANILVYNSSIHAFFGKELISPAGPNALKESSEELLKLLNVKRGGSPAVDP